MKWIVFAVLILIPITASATTTYTSTDVAQAVIKSIKEEPDHWFRDAFKIYYFKDKEKGLATSENQWEYEADCVIWIANGPFGIEIKNPQRVKIERDEDRQFIWDTYQKWATGFFMETVFHMKKPPPQLKDQLPEKLPFESKDEVKQPEEKSTLQYKEYEARGVDNEDDSVAVKITFTILIPILLMLSTFYIIHKKRKVNHEN